MRGSGKRHRGKAFAVTAVLVVVAASFAIDAARAGDAKHILELQDGGKVEGKILAVTKRHVVVDVPGRPRFVERSQVSRATDAAGSPVELQDLETAKTRDVLGIVVKKLNDILVHRGQETFKLEIATGERIADASVRAGDELLTGASGNVTLVVPGDAQLFASIDADVIFAESGPTLREGALRAEGGDLLLAIPEGKVHARDAILAAEHVKDRTQLRCIGGTCELQGKVGYKLVLHKGEVIDVANAIGDHPPYVAASSVNVTTIWIDVGQKRIPLNHGEKFWLDLGAPRGERPREDAVEPAPKPDMPPPGDLARVTRADAAFTLTRSGQRFTIQQADATRAGLKAGDEVATEEGTATVAFRDRSELELAAHTTLVVYPEDSTLPVRLARGSARVTPSGKLRIAVPQGEVAMQDGPVSVALGPITVSVAVSPGGKGKAGLFVRDVSAELKGGASLDATVSTGQTKLEDTIKLESRGAQPVEVTCTSVFATLRERRSVTQGRASDGTLAVTLWNDARLEIEQPLSATIVEDQGDLFAYITPDGRHLRLEPGKTLRVSEQKGEKAKPDPRPDERPLEPVKRDPEPSPPPPPPERVVAAKPLPGREVVKLSNGAELTLVNWGKLEQQPSANNYIEVKGPGGSPLFFGPNTKATLARPMKDMATVTTADKRKLTWNAATGTAPFDYRLQEDGKLRISANKDRTLVVDPGKDFEVELRDNGLVCATLVQNTVFVRAGDNVLLGDAGIKITHGQIDIAKNDGK